MPTITVTTNAAGKADSPEFAAAVLILGKNRNFIKNELSKNINIFETRIFTDDGFLNVQNSYLPKRLIIIAGDDRAKAVETAVMCKNSDIETIILTEKPIFHAENYCGSVITVQNADLAECITAVSSAAGLCGAYEYLYGTGETPIAAAAQVFSKLPEHFYAIKVFTNVPENEANELFSLVCGHIGINSYENKGRAVFDVFLSVVKD
jgi:hypothetical protein